MISIIIPLYNKESYIGRAIQSVLNQTFTEYEIIVVNDGSTDKGVEVIKGIDDARIRVIHQENQGVSAARNRGLQEAQYDWVAFLDADDAWNPQFLSTMLHLRESFPECDICASAYQHVSQDGQERNLILNRLPFEGKEGVLSNYFEVAAFSNPPICSISVTIKKSALLEIGGFPLDIKSGEDLLTWARLAASHKIAYCKEPLATFFPERETYYSKPSRIPEEGDPVGKELVALQEKYPSTIGLNDYIAQWHKMRASIYLRLPDQKSNCRKEIAIAKQFSQAFNKKLVLYRLLSLTPYNMRMKLFSKL